MEFLSRHGVDADYWNYAKMSLPRILCDGCREAESLTDLDRRLLRSMETVEWCWCRSKDWDHPESSSLHNVG